METQEIKSPELKDVKFNLSDSKYATGRRKRSIARVWLKKGSGNIIINKKKMIDYFKKTNLQIAVCRPLALIKRENGISSKSFGSSGLCSIA